MAQNITLMGASYQDVPAVTLPKTGGGTARFTDTTPTTATDSDVASGKIYFKADGSQSTGTASGGGATLQAKTNIDPTTSSQTITADEGYDGLSSVQINAMPSGTEGTPTATKSAVSNHAVTVTPSVTNSAGYISGGTHNGTAVSVSASELVSGTYTVSSSGTKDVTNYASISVASGGATASATKGTVSNHSITVTPSVTRTAGYITAGSANGTAVTVSASELVSGSQTLSDKEYQMLRTSALKIISELKITGGCNVQFALHPTSFEYCVVDVQGGGSGGTQIATKTATPSVASSSIQFTGLSGNPTSFVVTSSADIATNTDGVTAVVFDGSSLHGQTMTTQVEADTGFTKSYSNGTLTITATSAQFQANAYKLVYTYGGFASDIETADVQVGSGATSITFPVNGRPAYWSCIFKSNFSTSSGYQRVIAVANDGSSTYGLAMDSSAHSATSWTASYSGGNLVITSQGTNNGGYFHQPGYYQLTYYVDSSAPSYQSKTVSPSTSSQTVYPDSGYDALESVTVNAMPSMTLPSSASATSSGTSKATITPTSSVQYLNIPTGYNATAQYYTIGASGGGGGDKNVQISQSTTRNNASSLTKANGDLTVSKTGTYDIYWTASRSNTSTSYTWGSRLYVDGTAYGTENTSWSNNVQNNHLSNVSLTANQKLAVYTRGRSGNYYTYAPMLLIIES